MKTQKSLKQVLNDSEGMPDSWRKMHQLSAYLVLCDKVHTFSAEDPIAFCFNAKNKCLYVKEDLYMCLFTINSVGAALGAMFETEESEA